MMVMITMAMTMTMKMKMVMTMVMMDSQERGELVPFQVLLVTVVTFDVKQLESFAKFVAFHFSSARPKRLELFRELASDGGHSHVMEMPPPLEVQGLDGLLYLICNLRH